MSRRSLHRPEWALAVLVAGATINARSSGPRVDQLADSHRGMVDENALVAGFDFEFTYSAAQEPIVRVCLTAGRTRARQVGVNAKD